MADSYPRQKARTRNFTLGAPRDFRVAADGGRITFLRSPAGDDPLTALWVYEFAAGEERLVTDPAALGARADALEPTAPEEQARRERKRESAQGIVAYAIDAMASLATFALAGTLWIADLQSGETRSLDTPRPVFDPRPSPAGSHVAYVHDRALHVAATAGGPARRLMSDTSDTVTWGLTDFIAAEEMGRDRGYWWAPDGMQMLVARVDEAPVQQWWISDIAAPGSPPRPVRYPVAGSHNAMVSLHLVPLDAREPLQVQWDHEAFPYLQSALWDAHGPLIAVQTRDHQRLLLLSIDSATGATTPVGELSDEAWVEPAPGTPRRLCDGRLVTVATVGDTASLLIAGSSVTPSELEVRAVLDANEGTVVFTASSDPTEVHVWCWSESGELTRLTAAPGVHTAVASAGTCIIGSRGLEHDGVRWSANDHVFASRTETPMVDPHVELMTVGERKLRVGLVLPKDHESGTPIPILLDPYGGPGHQRVVAARDAWRETQWLADQGFAVIVADGRGTPGRGRSWSRAIHRDLAGPPLEDQITSLHEVAARHADLDLGRVAIRGWSFGGYLAALAVLRRPDVFHAAVAGAPVTDWRLYDTYYTERYLGVDPRDSDETVYGASSLLDDAPALERPLLLIHGLTDDNVVAAHTLTLSRLLLEAGRPHSVLPLSGVTHMTPQPAVAENLLLLQVDFLRHALRT
jgi:dipeptidyl-peptidase-4